VREVGGGTDPLRSLSEHLFLVYYLIHSTLITTTTRVQMSVNQMIVIIIISTVILIGKLIVSISMLE
jgi:hypothetical protein